MTSEPWGASLVRGLNGGVLSENSMTRPACGDPGYCICTKIPCLTVVVAIPKKAFKDSSDDVPQSEQKGHMKAKVTACLP